ncbi:protein DUF3108 [Candidatus Termititenax persephonae]|uniref:Protein DUF3108 n=1 Tax=Candidatus Termititenax persephonae TaxID=2218525 RepID=A0A388TI66_9BACT|nr:protein DUF3108 [Candidatus Termititenax persephonae]
MRKIILLTLLTVLGLSGEPALKNNGFPEQITFFIKDYINKDAGFVTASISMHTVVRDGQKYYQLESIEGKYFHNTALLNQADFTTIEEKRYAENGELIEFFAAQPDGTINFFHRDKKINLTTKNLGNVYSRYAFLVSLSGFPFEQKDKVVMNVYMFEYGNALPLRAVYQGKEKIKVPAGEFECYKLELAVDGLLGLFAPDKYYLYYTVAAPHHFVRFYQKVDDGSWLANELLGVSY